MIKSDKFEDLKYAYSNTHFFHFGVDQHTNYLKLIFFYMFVEYTIGYIRDFFHFFETYKYIFSTFLIHQISGVREHKISTQYAKKKKVTSKFSKCKPPLRFQNVVNYLESSLLRGSGVRNIFASGNKRTSSFKHLLSFWLRSAYASSISFPYLFSAQEHNWCVLSETCSTKANPPSYCLCRLTLSTSVMPLRKRDLRDQTSPSP